MNVELKGITKRFPGVTANSNVNLSLIEGEVHALLGENGAGKSTLMNILFGLYKPTEGQILVDGEAVELSNPSDAIARGIGMVHQHFMLVPVFTVTENVMLGLEQTSRFGLLDRDAARARLLDLSNRYGLHVDPDAVVEDLPVGVQQRVEILKALYRGADCLILDEPTAVLTPNEIRDLFKVIESLKADGRAIVFITHKLKEVLAIADRITVLRRGEVVGSTEPQKTTEGQLATMMVGRDVLLDVEKDVSVPGPVVMRVSNLEVQDDRAQQVVNGVSFEIRAGEIVAIAGVQGNGQTELVEAITGLRKVASGEVFLGDKDITGRSPRSVFKEGVAHIPEDRQRDGLVESFSIKDNMVLNEYWRAPYSRGIAVDRKAIERDARKLSTEFDVRTSSIDAAASTLSGGNQQKVIVAREFSHADRLLIASQPTRGLDVGSIQYIHAQIVSKRDEGKAVMLISSELDEILGLADRIVVMYEGRIVQTFDRADASREKIGLSMGGTVVE